MRHLPDLHLLCLTKLKVMMIIYLVHLSETVKITSENSVNGMFKFKEGSQAILICTITPYPGEMHWEYESTEVANCFGQKCNQTRFDLGAFQFLFNTSTGIFKWIISSVETNYHNTKFGCYDGSNRSIIYMLVKGNPKDDNNNKRAVGAVAFLSLLIVIFFVFKCCVCYHCNCCRTVDGATRITMTAEHDLHPVVLEWNNTCIKENWSIWVITDQGNERTTKTMTREQFKKRKCFVYGLEPKTTYSFRIEVNSGNGQMAAKSCQGTVETLDFPQLQGEANSDNEITLWWKCSINDENSTMVLKKTINSSQNLNNGNAQWDSIYINDEHYGKSHDWQIVKTIKQLTIEDQRHTLSNLEAGTRYVFLLEIKNSQGRIVTRSNAIEIKTLELQLTNQSGKLFYVTKSDRSEIEDLKDLKTFVKKDHDIPKLSEFKQLNKTKCFEIDGLDAHQNILIWIQLPDKQPSNIVNTKNPETTAIELRLIRRQQSEARFVVIRNSKLCLQNYVLIYGTDESNKKEQNITDINECIVKQLDENVWYWYYMEATGNGQKYSSNIIRDTTLGKAFIRQRQQ